MPKKTRPITVLTEEELNALDDATFDELAADEERLNLALQDPATIRSGEALSIAKTKPRRKTASRKTIVDEIFDRAREEGFDIDAEYIDPPVRDTGTTSVHDQVSAHGTVHQGDVASVVSTRGDVDHDDAATQVDDDLAMQPPVARGRDWDRELPLSTDPAVTQVRRQSPKTSITTLPDTMAKPKPAGSAVTVVVTNQPSTVPVGVPTRRAAPKTTKPRPTVAEVRSLQDQLALSQKSSAQQLSLLRQQLSAQQQAFTAERDEMKLFMTNLMKQQRGEQVDAPAPPQPMPIIDMVDEASESSDFSYLTGDESEGQSTVPLSNVQGTVAPVSSTVVPLPKAPTRQETSRTPKAVVTSPAPTLPGVTVVPHKQVRVPVAPAMTQSAVVTQDTNHVPLEVVQPLTQVPISAPVVTVQKSATPIAPGTPVSYGTASPAQMTDIQKTMYPPTPIAPPVVTTTVPDTLPVTKPHTSTDMGPPKQTRPRQQRVDDTTRPVSSTTADFTATVGPYRASDTGLGNTAQSEVRPLIPPYTPAPSASSAGANFMTPRPSQPWSPETLTTPSTVGMVSTIMTMPSKTDVPRIHTWSQKEILSFDTWCRNHQIFTLPIQEGWRIIYHLFPPAVLALMDAFVNGQRTKVGMPRADVNTLMVGYVIKTLRDCAPDDSVSSDYNKKMNFVGNLINKTGNKIPESRLDGIKMYQAINTVLTASPSEFTTNMDTFRRSVHQWASSLQGHKSLTDGSQLSLKASFVDYITYGMHNQQIVDIKEMGERVLQFAIKREEPVLLYHQHQDQYRAPDTDYSSRARSRSRSPPHKRHRPDNRGKQRDNSRSRGDKPRATDSPADKRHSTTTTRPPPVLCYQCGKKHGPVCKLTMHPDVNTNSAVKWADTITGRAMALADAGTSLDLKNRWSHSEKRMVPLEASVVDAI